jgi:Domain of unknown function (DUF397)
MEQVGPRWRKASYSGNGANCVEAGSVPGAILIRDTKNRGRGPVLCLSPRAFADFTTRIRRDTAL